MLLSPLFAGFFCRIMKLSEKIIQLKGVGEKTVTLYNRLGIEDLNDLIHYYPRDYVYYEDLTSSNDFTTGKIIAFKAVVMGRALNKKVRRLTITSVKLRAGSVLVTATWFHMPFLNKMLSIDEEYVFRGKLSAEGDHYHIEQAQIFSVDQYEQLKCNIAPIYSLTKGLTNNSITKTMKKGFEVIDDYEDVDHLYQMHFPSDYEALSKARQKLVFDEFLLFILRLRLLKEDNEVALNDFNIIEVANCERVIERLPYKLTNAQLRVWEEIKSDLCSHKSMSRLVQGDVGSGKTILAVLSALQVAFNGYQAAVMAPTEILAAQHFEFFNKIIRENGFDINVVLLTGSLTAAGKRKVRQTIESGEANIIIGTHALIQDKVVYNNLALVITDEQHRFGVNQRELLSDKNQESSVHVLVMSATPIPRTLSIIMYGDLSISIIDEVPAQKLPIKNAVVGEKYRKKTYDFIQKEVEAGHQAYVICPLVEESEGLTAKDVLSYTDELSAIFPDTIRIGCLHGKMKPKDKQKVMDDFACNNIQILVSTTVVEVGVNVPNATVMLIEDADRFGLAQLHQLRGRVGRGSAQSYCIFMSSNDGKKTMERLEVLNHTNDGFKIAEEDLKQRGPGDMFGIRQSGQMQFKLADIYTDANILKEAADEATRILEEDPTLSMPKHQRLKEELDATISAGLIGKTI